MLSTLTYHQLQKIMFTVSVVQEELAEQELRSLLHLTKIRTLYVTSKDLQAIKLQFM